MERSARLDMHGYRNQLGRLFDRQLGQRQLPPSFAPSEIFLPPYYEESWLWLLHPNTIYIPPDSFDYRRRDLIAKAHMNPPMHTSDHYIEIAQKKYGERFSLYRHVRPTVEQWDECYARRKANLPIRPIYVHTP